MRFKYTKENKFYLFYNNDKLETAYDLPEGVDDAIIVKFNYVTSETKRNYIYAKDIKIGTQELNKEKGLDVELHNDIIGLAKASGVIIEGLEVEDDKGAVKQIKTITDLEKLPDNKGQFDLIITKIASTIATKIQDLDEKN